MSELAAIADHVDGTVGRKTTRTRLQNGLSLQKQRNQEFPRLFHESKGRTW